MAFSTRYDAVIVGSGHNGLVAAAYLANAGQSVLVLERNDWIGGATASQRVFPDYEAFLSRYAYLVSLLPRLILDELGISFETRRRSVASFTAYERDGAARGLVISDADEARSKASLRELTGGDRAWDGYQALLRLEGALAAQAWPSLLRPIRSRGYWADRFSASALEREAWESFVERPLGEAIESHVQHDVLRGLLFTDGKIGVFSHAHDPSLIQNRCFLYHVIGQGTGEWRVPVGGMRTLVDGLIRRATDAHARIEANSPVAAVYDLGKRHAVVFEHDGREQTVDADRVLVNAGPRTFARLFGREYASIATDEGSVTKVNMLLCRLPRLRAPGIAPAEAFAGSFHVDEGYAAMEASYRQAEAGALPELPPFEIYCHTLTDDSILSPALRAEGYQTLTLFGLDAPYRLFAKDEAARKEELTRRYLAALNRVTAEPFEDCLARDSKGGLCIEIKSPQDLERELDLDLGNIFHNSLSWFFTDDPEEDGTWGVETDMRGVYRCGSSALRGGAVSGVPGFLVARKIFEEERVLVRG
ncbi:MAG: FAD-dependent oxidoreductase [Gemmatimonadetes bacterium]|nr:FAD-dependent oxidoreductase [Gemmatimonadota bacterium]